MFVGADRRTSMKLEDKISTVTSRNIVELLVHRCLDLQQLMH